MKTIKHNIIPRDLYWNGDNSSVCEYGGYGGVRWEVYIKTWQQMEVMIGEVRGTIMEKHSYEVTKERDL